MSKQVEFGVDDWKRAEAPVLEARRYTCPKCPPPPDGMPAPPGVDWRLLRVEANAGFCCATHGYFWHEDYTGWGKGRGMYDGPERLLRHLGVEPNLVALSGRSPGFEASEEDWRRYDQHVSACEEQNRVADFHRQSRKGEPGCACCSDEGPACCIRLTDLCPNDNCEWCAETPE